CVAHAPVDERGATQPAGLPAAGREEKGGSPSPVVTLLAAGLHVVADVVGDPLGWRVVNRFLLRHGSRDPRQDPAGIGKRPGDRLGLRWCRTSRHVLETGGGPVPLTNDLSA